jgi:hypothetical protein
MVASVIILVAVIGKFVGSAIAAKFVGQTWKESLIIGALMNTRGLMELVVLNIGYDLGVLTPEVFAMMVIMALVTTFMTGPALDFINFIFRKKEQSRSEEVKTNTQFNILFSFGTPESGKTLFKLSNLLSDKKEENNSLTAMHLLSAEQSHTYNIDEYESENFELVIDEANEENKKISILFKVSNDIETDIINIANNGKYDLLVIGLRGSLYEGTFIGKVLGFTTKIISPEKLINSVTRKEKLFDTTLFDDRTNHILQQVHTKTAVFFDRKIEKFDRIAYFYIDNEDAFILDFAQRFITNNQSQISVIDYNGSLKENTFLKEKIRAIEQTAPNHITTKKSSDISGEFLQDFDLILISTSSWKYLCEQNPSWLTNIPSTLIFKA